VYRETFATGVATFEYKKEQYAIKLIFRKGKYDIEKGTYVSIPWAYILNITNVDKTAPLQAYLDLNDIVDSPVTTTSGDKIKIKNAAGMLSIVSQGGFFEKTIFSIQHDRLFKLWADNAENYKRTIHGKIVYLVPQMSRSKEGQTQVGFVANEGKPLSDFTGRPLDFIALCQAKDEVTCRSVRYSIPLGLKFKYLGIPGTNKDKDFFYWQIEEMVNDDLYDALDDEALEAAINP
jgi:hypothetical protein